MPETAFETLAGTALVGWMLSRGFLPVPATPGELPAPDVSLYIAHPILATGLTLVVVALAVVAFRWVRRRFTGRRRPLAPGPRDLLRATSVRGRRRELAARSAASSASGSLLCFLAAFGLPATLGAALLVMAAQGGGRIVPIAPVSAGLRIAMLTYGLVEVTGRPVDAGAISVFTFGMSAVFFAVGLAISLVLISRELGTISPRGALREARARLGASPRIDGSASSSLTLPFGRSRRWSISLRASARPAETSAKSAKRRAQREVGARPARPCVAVARVAVRASGARAGRR